MSEQETCITTVVTRLWGNQMATCEALHVLALLLTETGHPERAERVMQVSKRLLDSSFVIEPAISALVEISRKRFQPANDDDGASPP
ncbi:hypothetical protein QUC26_04700 [Pseudomonas asiatica]|uniref:hypothetical protein n=1 Tax=Pseudomonas asiatica TaxID=2219225 RepID=UPI0025A0BBCD|nr:hypothetical protein [Pseudomonas asiatica]WJM54474.1 hypothetical protein QUC26_04700 [Pseudomonas asiatica]